MSDAQLSIDVPAPDRSPGRSPVAPYCSTCFGSAAVCEKHPAAAGVSDADIVGEVAAGEYPAYGDDPAPTTGPPADYYEFPDGCRCQIRDDVDYGEHYSPPPEGCPVHTPWAFPGYSLDRRT